MYRFFGCFLSSLFTSLACSSSLAFSFLVVCRSSIFTVDCVICRSSVFAPLGVFRFFVLTPFVICFPLVICGLRYDPSGQGACYLYLQRVQNIERRYCTQRGVIVSKTLLVLSCLFTRPHAFHFATSRASILTGLHCGRFN